MLYDLVGLRVVVFANEPPVYSRTLVHCMTQIDETCVCSPRVAGYPRLEGFVESRRALYDTSLMWISL